MINYSRNFLEKLASLFKQWRNKALKKIVGGYVSNIIKKTKKKSNIKKGKKKIKSNKKIYNKKSKNKTSKKIKKKKSKYNRK